jgi:hypothetical protein
VKLSELRADVVPPIVFETSTHARICDRAARQYLDDEDPVLIGTLANYYSRHADDCANGTAIMFAYKAGLISRESRLTVSGDESVFGLDSRAFEGLLIEESSQTKQGSERLRSFRFRLRTLLRAVAHRLFRLFGKLAALNGKGPGDAVSADGRLFRTWVDVSLEIFQPQPTDGVILVYPFPLNLRRQMKYIGRLRSEGFRFQLFGAPYSLLDVASWATRPCDRRLAEIERDTMRRHAHELVERFGAKSLITSEDFEFGTFALGSSLRDLGVRVENFAHGVGKYCPYVSYDRFVVLNDAQENYYRQFGDVGQFDYFPEESFDWSAADPRSLVLVDQLIVRDGSLLDKLEEEILAIMKTVAAEYDLAIAVKLHPNSKLSTSERRDGVEQVRDIRWLPGEAIFITVFSTAYLTFRELGQTLLVGNRYIDPKLVFGNRAPVVDISDLEGTLKEMCDAEANR